MIKHGFYKTTALSFVLISSSLLGACTNLITEEVSIEQINDNYYSKVYYNQINDLIDEYLKYVAIVNKKDIDESEILEMSNDFLLKLNSYSSLPKTNADYQLDKYLSEFKYEINKSIEYRIKYIEDQDIGAMYESDNYNRASFVTYDILIKLKDKYKLKGD